LIVRWVAISDATYNLSVDAVANLPDPGTASLDTGRMLVEVEAWPAG
jgi:hypothetical protein